MLLINRFTSSWGLPRAVSFTAVIPVADVVPEVQSKVGLDLYFQNVCNRQSPTWYGFQAPHENLHVPFTLGLVQVEVGSCAVNLVTSVGKLLVAVVLFNCSYRICFFISLRCLLDDKSSTLWMVISRLRHTRPARRSQMKNWFCMSINYKIVLIN